MPNWVRNRVSITGTKENLDKLWTRLVKSVELEKGFLETFKPMPAVLLTFSTGGSRDWRTQEQLRVWRDTPKGAEKIPEEEMAAIIKEHGTASWYDWACAHWGVKWDGKMSFSDEEKIHISRGTRSISIDWDAAWSYPEPIYQMIANEYKVHVSVRLSGEWEGEPHVSFDPVDED